MRRFLKSSVRLLKAGGFWAAVVLVLPNCAFNPGGLGQVTNFEGGYPRTDAIFCDIERPLGRHCATDAELARGIRLSEAAIALAEGRSSDVALDDSADAIADCGGPRAILFQGPFPDGFGVCVNCDDAIGAGGTYADVTTACQTRCLDFFGPIGEDGAVDPDVPPAPAVVDFCNAVSKASTNFPATGCFLGVCEEGMLRMDFVDPRRTPEPVSWGDLIGVTPEGAESNDLRRTAAEALSPVWDAGAVSTQWITKGDAWLEFGTDPGKSIVVGLTEIAAACAPPCTDTDPSDISIDFGLLVAFDGGVFVLENGALAPGPLATADAASRFRVRVRANADGTTAQIRYSIVIGPCTLGTVCNETELHTSTVTANYPLRVDSSLFHADARITNARLVRIR